jgi:hypothetical protein
MVAEFFEAFVTPRKIEVKECFQTVGAVCRALLEVLNQDY